MLSKNNAMRHKREKMMQNGYMHTFHSKKGQVIKVRPLKPIDAHYLVDLFNHMGPTSRYLRFNLALTNPDPELVWAEAQRLARIDPERDGAWLAFSTMTGQPDVAVAGVRFMRVNDKVAEASIAVRDDMQNQGIGTELLRFLVDQAQAAGIEQLVATVQRGNRALWQLLAHADIPIDLDSEGGYTTMTADLLKSKAD